MVTETQRIRNRTTGLVGKSKSEPPKGGSQFIRRKSCLMNICTGTGHSNYWKTQTLIICSKKKSRSKLSIPPRRSRGQKEVIMFSDSFGLLVCGSRGISDYQLFASKADHLLSEVPQWRIHIITGDARGVDEMARRYAEERGFELHTFYAMWNEHGKSAGYRRNVSMFKFLMENFQNPGCFAMWDGQSKGTDHSIGLARYWKIPLRIIRTSSRANPNPTIPAKEEFVKAPKWFQDDPDVSSYDRFLIRQEAEKKQVEYIEENDYTKRRNRKRLLKRAAMLAEKYGVWADQYFPEETAESLDYKLTCRKPGEWYYSFQ